MRVFPVLRWGVLIVDLAAVVGHEHGGVRRCLVVSYEPFHRSGRVTICPITAARDMARYPNEVPIPVGEGGQTKPGVILVHQLRTITYERARRALTESDGPVSYVTDPAIRAAVRSALQRHLGLDIPAVLDGAELTGA